MYELKPCPICGEAMNLAIMHNRWAVGKAYYVQCRTGMCINGESIARENTESAITAWNALPRVLQWTDKPPTEPGLYLVRMRKSGAVFPQYVNEKDIENGFLDTFSDDWAHVAGPISMPEFDKNDG